MTCPVETPIQEELVTDIEWKDENGGVREAQSGEETNTVCRDGIEYTEKIKKGRLDVFTDYTMAEPYNGINLDVVELYAGGSTTAVALVLEGYGLKKLRSSEFNHKQRTIATHNLQTLHRLFPERVSQDVVDDMHKTKQDVRQLSADDISGADIVSAGFPCQDMSRANKKRKGFKGGRSGQYYALEKLLKRLVRLEPSSFNNTHAISTYKFLTSHAVTQYLRTGHLTRLAVFEAIQRLQYSAHLLRVVVPRPYEQ